MAKNRVIFTKGDSKVVGILQKFEVPLFDAQRGLENFHVVKMDEEELDDSFEYLDMGLYIPVYHDDLIVFPHEEYSLIEIADSRMDIYIQSELPKGINRMLKCIRMTPEEESIVQVALGTTMSIFGSIVDCELNPEDTLKYRDYLLNIMKEFDVRMDYK